MWTMKNLIHLFTLPTWFCGVTIHRQLYAASLAHLDRSYFSVSPASCCCSGCNPELDYSRVVLVSTSVDSQRMIESYFYKPFSKQSWTSLRLGFRLGSRFLGHMDSDLHWCLQMRNKMSQLVFGRSTAYSCHSSSDDNVRLEIMDFSCNPSDFSVTPQTKAPTV